MFEASVIKWIENNPLSFWIINVKPPSFNSRVIISFSLTEKNLHGETPRLTFTLQKFETKLHGPLNIFTHYDTSVTNLKRQTLTSSSIETLLFGSESDLTLILCVNLRHPEGPAEVSCFPAS